MVRAINLAPDTLWCVLDDLPDNVGPSAEAKEAALQSLEDSPPPVKKLVPSKPKPHANEGDDDESEGDQDLVNPQAGPSTYHHPQPPRRGEAHQTHPAPILPVDHGLVPLNETMVSTQIQQISSEVTPFIHTHPGSN